MRKYDFYVYIITNKQNGTLYVGVTNNLKNRIYQHKHKLLVGFSKENNLKRLVYYSYFDDIRNAIEFEKRLKRWRRKWKLQLIEEKNPLWRDLYEYL